MDGDNLKNWGCGCLGVILFLWFGVPALGWVWDKTAAFVGGVKANYDAKVAQRQAEKESAEQKRQAEEQRVKDEAARAAEAKAQEEARLSREARLRDFAMKDAPIIWKTYQDLQGVITKQNKRIADLAKTLKEFDKEPSQDADYMRICAMRDEMVASVKSMHAKIEDAYLAFCKFQATPSRKDYDELRRKMLEDGIKEAEAAARRFEQMRSMK